MLTVRKSGALSALLVVGLVPALASAQVTKKGSTYEFRPKFTKGSTFKYSMTTTVSGAPAGNGQSQPMTMLGSYIQKVTAIKNNVAEIQYTTNPMTMNGQPVPGQPTKPVTATVQWDLKANKPLDKKSEAVLGNLPTKPLKVGGTYTSIFPTGGMGNLTAKYKFVGIKTVGGKQVAQFDVSVPKQESMPMSGSGTVYLFTSDVSLHSATFNMEMSLGRPTSGKSAPPPMKMKMVMKRA